MEFLSAQPTQAISPLSSDNHLPPGYPPALLLVSSDASPAEGIKGFLFQGSDIVIGTPGQIEEFLLGQGKGIVNVTEPEVLVLDEADRYTFPRIPSASLLSGGLIRSPRLRLPGSPHTDFHSPTETMENLFVQRNLNSTSRKTRTCDCVAKRGDWLRRRVLRFPILEQRQRYPIFSAGYVRLFRFYGGPQDTS